MKKLRSSRPRFPATEDVEPDLIHRRGVVGARRGLFPRRLHREPALALQVQAVKVLRSPARRSQGAETMVVPQFGIVKLVNITAISLWSLWFMDVYNL